MKDIKEFMTLLKTEKDAASKDKTAPKKSKHYFIQPSMSNREKRSPSSSSESLSISTPTRLISRTSPRNFWTPSQAATFKRCSLRAEESTKRRPARTDSHII